VPAATSPSSKPVRAQFPGVPGLTSLDRLHRWRNQAEYPEPHHYDPITPDEVTDALTVAIDCLATARRGRAASTLHGHTWAAPGRDQVSVKQRDGTHG
jgi:hypothetical protein